MPRRSFTVVALATLLLTLGAPAAPAKPKVRDLLPDLVALPTRTVLTSGAVSCQPVEMVEQGARRCLRFDQLIANVGAGAFEIRYGVETLLSTQELRQRIYRSDGTARDRFADRYEFHAAHAHFHYKSFGLTRLWASDQSGTRLGTAPVRDGRKNGFCVIDVENQWADRADSVDEPQYHDPQCQVPSDTSAGVELVQGISRGWADIYGLQVEGQYVEISGVPDGFYLLETIADPENSVLELDEANNSVFVQVQLCDNHVQLYPPPDFDACP